MTVLSIDIETYSSVDLKQCGVYAYTEADDFEILLFGYAFNDEPINIVDLASGEKLPDEIIQALTDPEIIKTAFNANFERICISVYFNISQPPQQWRCTQVHALTLGLPSKLEDVAKVLKLKEQKMTAGKNLIRYFSMPCKPTKANGQRTRNLPEHAPVKWEQFKVYCAVDVEVERAIRRLLLKYKMSDKEQQLWELDQKINDTGVKIDSELVANAIKFDTKYNRQLENEAIKITGLENPHSVEQIKDWLETRGLIVKTLSKETIPKLIEDTQDRFTKRVLELRQEMAKTSVKKYKAMQRSKCKDNRIRGLLQFYGASRTGRWAGRLVQVQNLPRNKLNDLALSRQLVKHGHYETLEMLYDSVPDVLSQLTRTAFIPSEGCRFIVADFSAIEARVIAWLANEKWRLDVFNGHGKIYEASASQMFGVPVESIKKGDELRQKGKIAELALGYQGSVGALKSMGALDMGLEEDELPELVSAWRQANPNIKQFWFDVEKAALKAVKDRRMVELQHKIAFSYESGGLFLRLPSGRRLTYVRPRIKIDERFDKECLTYEGIEIGKWKRLKTYGGKLVENIVQAVARDCLAEAMLRLDEAGYKIVMHVHDEAVLEMPYGKGSLEEACEIMGQPLSWAPGMPMNADGFECEFYKKD